MKTRVALFSMEHGEDMLKTVVKKKKISKGIFEELCFLKLLQKSHLIKKIKNAIFLQL